MRVVLSRLDSTPDEPDFEEIGSETWQTGRDGSKWNGHW